MNLSMSPDGRHVVYDFPADEPAGGYDIFSLTVDDRQATPLIAHPANDFVLSWAPDGGSILFTSDRTGHWGMWMQAVDQDGQPLGRAKLVKKDTGWIRPLGFTRAGSFYYGIGGSEFDVYTAELNLENKTVANPPAPAVQRFMGSNQSPVWSPDGRYLAYTSRRSPVPRSTLLCIRSEETGEVRELLPPLTRFRGLRWSPDGRVILTRGADLKDRRGAFLMDVQSGEVIAEAIKPNMGLPPDWASGGKAIVYTYKDFEKTESQMVWLDLETGKERRIGPLTKGSILNRVRVSPDDSQVAACNWKAEEEDTDLVLLSVDGGQLKTLVTVEGPEWIQDLAWARDGKHVLFFKKLGDLPHKNELWIVPTEGGTPRDLGIRAGWIQQLSVHPNGKRIAFASESRDDEPQVWVMERTASANP
jgi:Tol biopolymer transport system component